MNNRQGGGGAAGGQGPQGQDQRGQEMEYEDRRIRDAILKTPALWRFPFNVENARLDQAPQVRDVLWERILGPQERESIKLTLIIPGPYRKFPVIVALTQHELTMDIFTNIAGSFLQSVFHTLWGSELRGAVREPRAAWQIRLRQGDIWAVARSNVSLTLFLKNRETGCRCMVVLIPQDDLLQEQRTRLVAFGRALCRWAFPDQNQLMHYNPKACPAYGWLMQKASDNQWINAALPVLQEEQVLAEQGLFDTNLHYLYDPNMPLTDWHHLYRHFKYELKKALAIVAHRLFTRLESSRVRRDAEAAFLQPLGQQNEPIPDPIQVQLYNDFGEYRSYLAQYYNFYPFDQVNWDDPAIRNDARYEPAPNGPTIWMDEPQNQYVRLDEAQGQYVPVYQQIDYTHPAFQAHPMRLYRSLLDLWNVVERIEFQDHHMVVYVHRPNRSSVSLKVTYQNILFVRHCTIGVKSFSIHPKAYWGYMHFECELPNEIEALRNLTLTNLQARGIVSQAMVPEVTVTWKIGPLSMALFATDPTIGAEPALYWRVFDSPCADDEISKNYLALGCRLMNKLAITLADSIDPVTNEFNFENLRVLHRFHVYWNCRRHILPNSRQHSNLPHLVRSQLDRRTVFRMRHRWAYTTFDAPNDR